MTDETPKTVVVFCANEQKDTDHVIDIDGNGEILLTCECGRFLKFPADTTAEKLKEYIAAHKDANQGQVSIESLEAKKAALIEGLTASENAAV